MAQDKWINTSGGDFATAADWSTGAVPGSGDDALLTTAGTYTVTSNQNEVVHSIQVVQHVTLSIGNGSVFEALDGTGSGSNAGLIAVGNNSSFEVGGTIAGAGTIQLNSTNNTTSLNLNANTTLSGGGKVIMSDNGNNYIDANAVADTLSNVSDTISGSGQIGNGGMGFANGAAGVVNATGTAAGLLLNFGAGTASNAGLLEATGPAGMTIRGSTITQTGTGTIKAIGAGVAVNLDNSVITGGTLASSTGGVIQSVSNGEIGGVTITAGSTVQALNNTSLTLDNTITNKGTLELNSTNNSTGLRINTATVTLTGAGKLLLSDNSQNYIYSTNTAAPYDKLINVNNVISGSGQFGNGTLSVDNQKLGVIDATGTAASLVINTAGGSFSNEGLIEDTGPAGLQINSGTAILNTGTIGAFGATAHVDLNSANTVIEGGTLATSGGGVIQSTSNGTLDGLSHGAITITTGSQILVDNNTSLALDGAITNQGTITVGSVNNYTPLIINSATVTLTGAGAVTMSDNINNYIEAAAAGEKLVNVNNVITGSGQFGNNSGLVIDNQASGTIDSNGVGGITLNTGGGVFTNEGLVEDTNTGALTISNNTTIVNTGTIAAFGTGSAINLFQGSLQGGTLTTGSGGVIQSVNYGTLDGATNGAITISANSQIADDNNEYLFLDGSIVNHGTISLESTNNSTDLWIQSPVVTLSGAGALVLSDNGNNYIQSQTAGTELVNFNNTISGSGQVGNGDIAIDNQAAGIINSNGAAGMVLNTGTYSFTNEGLIEDTNTGGITVNGATTIINAGTLSAAGAGSFINLNSATIAGGTLSTKAGGVIQSVNIGTLDGSTAAGAVTITTGSQIGDVNNEYLYLNGTITNEGTISIESQNNATVLWINSGTVTLNGGGTVLLSDNGNNYIDASAVGNTLVNANNTIVGSGVFGNGSLNLINQASGTIDANGTNAGMTFTTASFTNQGVFEDTGTGGIGLAGITITNDTTIAALGAGSSISLYSGADIIGGTLLTTGGAVIQSTNVGTLDGATNGALTIAAGSTIADLNDQYLYLSGSIVNDGTIALDSNNNATVLWANSATLTLSGGGNVVMTDNTNNYIDASASGYELVNVNNTISGSGVIGNGGLALDNQKAGVIDSNGGGGIAFTTASFTNEGIVEATSTGGISLDGITVVNTGVIEALAGSFVNLNGSATIAGGKLTTTGGGVIQSTDTGTLDGSTTAGAITITAGSQIVDLNNEYLYLKGTITNTGTIGVNSANNSTVLWIDSGTVTLNGAGSVVLTDNGNNAIQAGGAGGDKLVNVGNKISGAGQIGNGGSLLIDNQKAGSINATGNNNLDINLGAATFTNEGLVEGSGAGGLLIQNTTLTNSGTIAALSASSVTVTSSVDVTNYNAGTLAGGTWEAIAATGTTSTLSLATGTVTDDAATLVISGAGASITTSGTSVLSTIGTIAGAGALVIEGGATFSGATLDDTGLLEAASKGVIVLAGGTFTNTGTLEALSAGTVELTTTEKSANLAAGKLTHGTWIASGSGSLLYLADGTITNDAAFVTLSGTGSSIKSAPGGKSLESTLITVSAGDQLNLLASRGFASTATAGIADSGTISLGGGTFSDTSLTIASGGTFQGGGTLAGAVADNGVLASSAAPTGSTGTLAVTGAITGTGLLSAGAATTLTASAGYTVGSLSVAAGGTVSGAGSVSGAVTVAGTLAIGATGTLTAGSVTVQSGGTVSAASIIASGTIADSGVITLSGGTLSGSSISVATSTADLTGYGTVVQTVANSGTITANGGTLTLGAGETGGTVLANASATLATQALAASQLTIAAGGSFIGAGTASTVADAGTLTASGGLLTLSADSGKGTAVIASGATLDSTSALTISALNFGTGGNQTLELGTPAGNTSLISDWGQGDTIDVLNTTVTSFTYAPAAGVLTLKDGTTTLGTLKFAGTYTKANFSLASDGHSGTDILFAGSAGQPADPVADLQAAVAATSGSAQAVGLTAAAPAPAALPTAPSMGASFNLGVPPEHAFDAPMEHFVA